MAKVDYIRPVEALHGKIAKEDEVGYARKASANNDGERVRFTQTYRKRDTTTNPYSTDERNQHTKFGAVCKMAAAVVNDSSKRAQAVAAFKNQSTYSTFKAFVWHSCEADYEAAQSSGDSN